MDWKTMLAYISGSVDEELLLRNEYLVAENRILREQFQGRLRLTDGQRRTMAEIGKRLGKQALDEIANMVKPETMLGRHRKLVRRSSTAPRIARIRVDRGSTTKTKSRSSWYASRRKTAHGVTIAWLARWQTLGFG